MNITIGKIYEITHVNIVETIVFDAKCEEIARLAKGDTFVAVEFLGIHPYPTPCNDINDTLLKMKILTPDGKIGFCSFWASEIKIVQN